MASAESVKRLREITGAGVMDCSRALDECAGDFDCAQQRLRELGLASAEKKGNRQTSQGLCEAYIHHDGRIGVLVEVNCETDFVARTDDFRTLVKELALHIASAKPLAVRTEDLSPEVVERERKVYEAQVVEQKKPEHIRGKIIEGMMKKFYEEHVLLEQKFVKDDTRTVGDLVREVAAKTGEKVHVRRFVRFERGGN